MAFELVSFWLGEYWLDCYEKWRRKVGVDWSVLDGRWAYEIEQNGMVLSGELIHVGSSSDSGRPEKIGAFLFIFIFILFYFILL